MENDNEKIQLIVAHLSEFDEVGDEAFKTKINTDKCRGEI
jgi:hypothetical protein